MNEMLLVSIKLWLSDGQGEDTDLKLKSVYIWLLL